MWGQDASTDICKYPNRLERKRRRRIFLPTWHLSDVKQELTLLSTIRYGTHKANLALHPGKWE